MPWAPSTAHRRVGHPARPGHKLAAGAGMHQQSASASGLPEASTATAVSEVLCGSIPMVITASAPVMAGTGTGPGGHSDLQTVAMPVSSHTTASAGRLGTLLRSQPSRRQEVCGPVPTGDLDAIGLHTRGVYGRFNKSAIWFSA